MKFLDFDINVTEQLKHTTYRDYTVSGLFVPGALEARCGVHFWPFEQTNEESKYEATLYVKWPDDAVVHIHGGDHDTIEGALAGLERVVRLTKALEFQGSRDR